MLSRHLFPILWVRTSFDIINMMQLMPQIACVLIISNCDNVLTLSQTNVVSFQYSLKFIILIWKRIVLMLMFLKAISYIGVLFHTVKWRKITNLMIVIWHHPHNANIPFCEWVLKVKVLLTSFVRSSRTPRMLFSFKGL